MKRLSKVAALLASAALIFGAVSCSDGGSSGGSSKPTSAPEPTPTPTPEPAGTEYKWSFAATDLLANLAWSADPGQSDPHVTTGTEYAKVKLDAAGTYESTPAGLTMNLAAGAAFNKVAPSGSVSSSVTINGASAGFIEPCADTVLSVSVKGPFTVTANVSANSSSNKEDRYAFIKVGEEEVAAPNKDSKILPAAGQVLEYSYKETDEVVVSVGGTGITRIFDVSITTENGEAGEKTAGEVISLGVFTPATDDSTANDEATLGLTGTSVESSAPAVATAEIKDGKIAITSVAAGSAVITVKNGENTATIEVSVNSTGAIAIGKITKYVAAGTPTVSYFTESTAEITATNGNASVITGGDVSFAFVVDGFTTKAPAAWTADTKVTFNGVKVGCNSTIKETTGGAKDANLTVEAGNDVGYAVFTVTAVKACKITKISASTGQTQSGNLGTAIYVNDTLVNTPAGNKTSVVEQTLATPVTLAAGENATIKVAIKAVKDWSKINQSSVACDMYFGNIVVNAEEAAAE